ncbi:MAG: hypothetical protein KF694_01845 [Mesorhizobium sp.]|nr:hypothetical protein [Mesorhizobium sp.]
MLPFPLNRRVGRIRDVAMKMLEKTTAKHSDHYHCLVDDALRKNLSRYNLTAEEQDRQLSMFWSAVRNEMQRISYHYAPDEGEAS